MTRPQQPELEELLQDIDKLEQIVATWDEEQRMTVIALLLSIDSLHKEAFARLVSALKSDKRGSEILEEASKDEVVHAVLRHFRLGELSLADKVEMALDTVRPALATHGGGVELVAMEPPATAVISLTGACNGCPASAMTLSEGVEKAIREFVPEILEIKKVVGSRPPIVEMPTDIKSPFA
ncbi:MAG: NifU family protein [Cyanobacteria bacterium SZAS TMP-1]|nr:NifU family protein [Cyanobacteria bacterium SZAS TMP-1]